MRKEYYHDDNGNPVDLGYWTILSLLVSDEVRKVDDSGRVSDKVNVIRLDPESGKYKDINAFFGYYMSKPWRMLSVFILVLFMVVSGILLALESLWGSGLCFMAMLILGTVSIVGMVRSRNYTVKGILVLSDTECRKSMTDSSVIVNISGVEFTVKRGRWNPSERYLLTFVHYEKKGVEYTKAFLLRNVWNEKDTW